MDNQRFNGSTKFINVMLSVIVLLLVAAITSQIQFNLSMTERLSKLEATMSLFLDGHIKER